MSNRTLLAAGVGGILLLVSTGPLNSAPRPSSPEPESLAPRPAAEVAADFLAANPGTKLSTRGGRITRVFGRAFGGGATPVGSAEAFRLGSADLFGLEPDHLAAAGDAQPIMYQPQTGTYKFTGVSWRQQIDGVPVFRGELKVLARNEPGYPLVLASANVRDLGGFRVAGARPARADHAAALALAGALSQLEGEPRTLSSRRVVWAGLEDEVNVQPRLADELVVGVGIDRWLILADAATGEVLYDEHLIRFTDIDGTVEGLATEGAGADLCEAEPSTPLPYLLVTAGANSAFSAADGTFTIPNPGTGSISVDAGLSGLWFDVFNFLGAETTESDTVTPPGPASLTFNSANTDELVRAQVNGYVHANVIRDWVLQYNPAYPTLLLGGFPVTVNRTDGFCPSNAWYDDIEVSINFCSSSGPAPNTAWSSVLYHEFGHHLVQAAGSGQGAYGEGTGDVMSILLLDNPDLGIGWNSNCGGFLRTAANACQYDSAGCSTCGSEIHDCGNLISGCVWSTRNELVATEPVDYLDILSNIAINAILVHTGSGITPDIAIDYLTLDDDDADLCNGSPHFDEIATGFGAHGMFVEQLSFSFPSGLPALSNPAGGTPVAIDVDCSTAVPAPGTGLLYVDTGGGFSSTAMTEGLPGSYTGALPESDCGTVIDFYFSVETTTGPVLTSPPGAPASSYSATSGTSSTSVFADDFEADLGWAVTNSGGLIDGAWDRGVPVGGGDRGDPPADADGSGQCYLTDNTDGNSDVDGGTTTLASPVLDGSDPESFIRYWRWFDNTAGDSPNQDVFVVEISDDAGGSWTTLETVGPVNEASGGWFLRTFKVSDVVSNTSQLRVRFLASDTDPQSVVEAAVDGVGVFAIGCEALGDVDLDGDVDVDDFLGLLAAWGPCPNPCPPSCAADFNNDCIVGVDDFLTVLANWNP